MVSLVKFVFIMIILIVYGGFVIVLVNCILVVLVGYFGCCCFWVVFWLVFRNFGFVNVDSFIGVEVSLKCLGC